MIKLLSLLMVLVQLLNSHQSPVPLSLEEIQLLKEHSGDSEPEDRSDNLQEIVREERSDPEDGSEDDGEVGKGEQLTADVSDTVKKINPLTIANQVSQMFKKGNKDNFESRYSEKNSNFCVQGAAAVNDPTSALSPEEGEGSCEDTGSRPTRRKNTKDTGTAKNLGCSELTVADDPVEGPINPNVKNVKHSGKSCEGLPSNDKRQSSGKIIDYDLKGELKVPKEFSFCPDFPIYDDDISFIPDPLQGLLDQHYWSKTNKIYD